MFDNRPRTMTGTWEELVAMLKRVVVTPCSVDPSSPDYCWSLDASKGNEKCHHRGMDGRVGMWGPAVFDGVPDAPKDGKTAEQMGWKSLPHVVAMDLLTYDVDHVTRAQLAEIDKAVQSAGLACIMYSTHSNDPAHNDYSVRFVFQLSAPILVDRSGNSRFDDKLRAFRQVIADRLRIPPDQATKDESRLYFMPTIPTGAKYLFGTTEGGAIDAGELTRIEASTTRGVDDSRKAGAGDVRDVPAPAPVLANLDELRELAIKSANSDIKTYMRRAMKGEVIVPDDSHMRDNTLCKLTASMAFGLPWGTPLDAMVELLRPSCSAWERRMDPDGRSWLAQAEYQLERALARREPEEAVKAAKKAEADELWSDYGGGPTGAVASTGTATETSKPTKLQKYTEDELAGFYAKAGVKDATEFRERWVIRYMGANWIWVNGRYQRPIKDLDLQWTLRRDLSRSPIVLWDEDKDGNKTPKKWQDILHYYSTVARGVQGSLSARESRYDAAEEVFHEAICPIRDLTPEFDPDIDQWLKLFNSEPLMDWVAAVSQLQHQCAAIYLKGEKGVGKTLFANGLARIWRTGGPTKFESVMGVSFNSSMADCPLIFADETLPKTDTIIDELRALIGSDTHDLNRKFMPTVSVRGSIRLIIAGNNEHLLNTPARLEASDVDAMAARVLYVDMTGNHRPAEFINDLKSKHTKAYVDAWVHGDKLAKHALYLAQTRPLNTDERFLVTGAKDFADRLNTQSGNVPAVFEFLARYLSDTSAAKQPTKLLKVGQGRLLVCTEMLADKFQFERFVPSRRVLSALATTQALKQVRTGVVEIDNKEYHDVKVDLFLWWVRGQQVGDLPTIKARIEAA